MKIGFIGLGIMGSRMAANLQNNGYDLIVYNRSRDKAAALIQNGATWADTPAAAATGVDILFTMVAHPQAVTAMALGENGFLDALSAGALWVDCSTTNPTFARQMADAATQRDIRFLDAPVAGSKPAAADARLRFIVGGEAADVETARPLFDVMGQQVIHVGGHGMGTALKVVVNMLLGQSMLAFAEGFTLGQALGIPAETLMNVLVGGPVVAPVIAVKRPKIENNDYEADFPLRWLQKDLQMVTQAAYDVGVALPQANAAKEAYQLAIRQGMGDLDFSAICAFLDTNNDNG